MTDMEKKVMIRLCAKIVAETDLYETDKEVQNLIDWVCLLSPSKLKFLSPAQKHRIKISSP